MKKSLFALISTLILATNAHAKTEGTYATFGVLHNNLTTKYSQVRIADDGISGDGTLGNSGDSNDYKSSKNKQNSYGIGTSVGYAFNFSGFFLTPQLFFDWDRLGKKNDNDKPVVNYSYGAKVNLGYDITDRFALYGIAGISRLNYNQYFSPNYIPITSTTNDTVASTRNIKTKTVYAPIFGAGAKFSVTPNVDLALEYTAQTFAIKPKGYEGTGVGHSSTTSQPTSAESDFYFKSRNRLDSIRLNLSYKFGTVGNEPTQSKEYNKKPANPHLKTKKR